MLRYRLWTVVFLLPVGVLLISCLYVITARETIIPVGASGTFFKDPGLAIARAREIAALERGNAQITQHSFSGDSITQVEYNTMIDGDKQVSVFISISTGPHHGKGIDFSVPGVMPDGPLSSVLVSVTGHLRRSQIDGFKELGFSHQKWIQSYLTRKESSQIFGGPSPSYNPSLGP